MRHTTCMAVPCMLIFLQTVSHDQNKINEGQTNAKKTQKLNYAKNVKSTCQQFTNEHSYQNRINSFLIVL